MSVYAIFTYDVTNTERYAKYNPGSLPVVGATIAKHGGEVVFADGDAVYEAGSKKHVNVDIEFPSVEAVHAWENDPEYAEVKAHQVESTADDTVFIAKAAG